MNLPEFLRETQAAVRSQMRDGALYEELVFSGIVMDHMSDIGMTFEPVECHFEGKVGNANLRLSGYSLSEESDQLDLFVSLYANVDVPDARPGLGDQDRRRAVPALSDAVRRGQDGAQARPVQRCALAGRDTAGHLRRLGANPRLRHHRPRRQVQELQDPRHRRQGRAPGSDGHRAAAPALVRGQAARRAGGRFHRSLRRAPALRLRAWRERRLRLRPDGDPGEALRLLYEKFGARLLEANVRSFLSVKGKGVNAGIQNTLRSAPERFMAYNNGIVIVADEMRLGKPGDGSAGIAWLKGLQIVNGGQTTASIYFAKKKYPDTDLSRVRVPAKIIVMKRAGLGQGGGARLRHLALRQQPERRAAIGPVGQQALPRRDREALALGLLPRRRRPMVLRARRRQLQHAARPRGDHAGQAQGLEGGHPDGPPHHQDRLGQIHHRLG